MIFTILQWLWLILLVAAAPLLVLRPIRLKMAAKKPVTDRMKSWLWFLQAVGFWALVIGGWMKVEALIPTLLEPDEEADDDESDEKDEDAPAEDDEGKE